MDIISHGLWSGAVYKLAQKKTKTPLKTKRAIFWGVFPDLFSFSLLFSWFFISLLFGKTISWPHPGATSLDGYYTLSIYKITALLYNLSHSLIIFFLIWSAFFVIFKKPFWELGDWLLHILIDIPTHSLQFYPTPFLWPLSNFVFDGLSWAVPWFLVSNYLSLFTVYIFLKKVKPSKPTPKQ